VFVVAGAVVLAACSGGSGSLGRRTASRAANSAATTTTLVPTTTTEPDITQNPALLVPPDSVEGIARLLTRVEHGLRTDGQPPETLRRLGLQQQLGYRALSNHPDWLTPVLDALPADLRDPVGKTYAAGSAVGGLTEPAIELPDWQIIAPPPAEELLGDYREAEAASGVPWAYFAAIHFVETRMGRIRGPSTAGAQGPMQFLPATWAEYGAGGDIYDNHDAILAAARFLTARGGAANVDRALFSYNPDDRYVQSIKGYAEVMLADARAFAGYHAWQVYYATRDATYLLPEGYPQVAAVKLPPTGQ